MSHEALDGTGLRLRIEIEGERYYLIATRATDGGMDYTVTVPDENKPTGQRMRRAAEAICSACSDLSRKV